MSKNIKINFIYPPKKDLQNNTRRFYSDILLTYINSLNLCYAEKRRVLEHVTSLFAVQKSG
jgi:hypothetical protein